MIAVMKLTTNPTPSTPCCRVSGASGSCTNSSPVAASIVGTASMKENSTIVRLDTPSSEPADDRGRGARDARDHRDRLKEADEERVPVRDLVEVRLTSTPAPEPLEHDESDAADHEREQDDGEAADQVPLDRLVHREADHAGRDHRYDELLQYARRRELPPVQHHHREDGAELDDDVEALQELVSGQPSARLVRIRCAVDEIGRNSVMPSTMPSQHGVEGVEHRLRGGSGLEGDHEATVEGEREEPASTPLSVGRTQRYCRSRSHRTPRTARPPARARSAPAHRLPRASLTACQRSRIAEEPRSRLSAIASTSPTAHSAPVSPSRTTSGSPPARDADDRHAGRERLERAQPERLALRWAGGTGPRPPAAARPTPACRGRRRCPARRAGAPPARRRRGRDRRRPSRARSAPRCATRAKMPTTSRTRFTGRKFETCISTFRSPSDLLAQLRRVARAVVDGRVDEVRDHLDPAAGAAERGLRLRRAGTARPR